MNCVANYAFIVLFFGLKFASVLCFDAFPSLVHPSVCERRFADLTDVTLADEDTDSILTDIANRAFQGNVAMKVTLPGGQLWNQCKRSHQ